MSDIPLARKILQELKLKIGVNELSPFARREIDRALSYMTREKACRRAQEKPVRISPAIRRRTRQLAREHPDMTITEIMRAVGLRNPGRVSEILHGKR